MSKNQLITRILTVFSALMLCVSTAYCWLLNSEIQHTDGIRLEYGSGGVLQVASTSLRVEVLYYDKASGKYIEMEGDGLTIGNAVPNEIIPIKIRFYNTGGLPLSVSLCMCGITTEGDGIENMMFVGFGGGEGFKNSQSSEVDVPDDVFFRLSDASENSSGEKQLMLYESLTVPNTGEDGFAELDGYFWFDRNATVEYSGMSAGFKYFRIVI